MRNLRAPLILAYSFMLIRETALGGSSLKSSFSLVSSLLDFYDEVVLYMTELNTYSPPDLT